MVVRTNPGVVLPPGSVWSLTAGQADDPPLQVGVLTGYEESSWSAPVARVLYLVADLAAASLEDAVIEALEASAWMDLPAARAPHTPPPGEQRGRPCPCPPR